MTEAQYVEGADARTVRMRAEMITFCSLLFVGALFVADATSVKLLSFKLFGMQFLLPGGTLAFAATFLATDVICEITGRRTEANKIIFMGLFFRILALLYYHLIMGRHAGEVFGLAPSKIWTVENQNAFAFVLGGTARIALAGLVSASLAFVNDTYVFNNLRRKYKQRNLYWLRNSFTTMISQIINSMIFISLAFGGRLTVAEIVSTTFGQIIWKIAFAWLDTPLAYLMRNYGQGRRNWYAFWKPKEFFSG